MFRAEQTEMATTGRSADGAASVDSEGAWLGFQRQQRIGYSRRTTTRACMWRSSVWGFDEKNVKGTVARRVVYDNELLQSMGEIVL